MTQPTSTQAAPHIRVSNLRKVYRSGDADLVLFDGLTFNVNRGEMLAIVGESGSGKSTLLHMLGALDLPTSGEILFGDTPVHNIARDDDASSLFRTREVGYVWQFHYLLPEFSALENIAMPLLAAGEAPASANQKAADWLRLVNLEGRGHHRPGELSGGEQQRIAIARALVSRPKALLADEPTGDLDNKTAELVFGLLSRLHQELGLTSVIVTHNLDFAARCQRVLRLAGRELREVAPGDLNRTGS
jgi:lipoprotein-releasing system ATP-binding protein